jgi:hypothetical protein
VRYLTLALSVPAVLALALHARATDWIVEDNPGPGVDFTTVQAAVDAAVTGDHVLVRIGTYAGFAIDGKGIVVAEGSGATAAVTSTVRISNTPGGTGVQLIGFTIDRSATAASPPFDAAANVGAVVISRCILRGFHGFPPTHAAHVASSTHVLFQDCEVRGGDAPVLFPISQGAYGLRVSNSQVELHGCAVRDGRGGTDWDGGDDDLYSGEAGGTALRLGSRQASGGTASLGFGAGDAPLSVSGAIPTPGTTRVHQVWYRNSAAFCSSATFNFTNGYEVRWSA